MMKLSSVKLAKILTYSGTLPLVACVFLTYLPMAGFDSHLLARTYAAIIISFLCGIHWAVHLFFAEKCPRNLLVTSNAVALLAWSSLLFTNQVSALILQSLCFVYLFMLDRKLHEAGLLSEWFYALRRNATVIVVVCLLIIAVFS